MPLDTPLSVKVAEWQALAAQRQLTLEETREIVKMLREGRIAAAATSAKSRAAKAPVDVSSMLDDIDNL